MYSKQNLGRRSANRLAMLASAWLALAFAQPVQGFSSAIPEAARLPKIIITPKDTSVVPLKKADEMPEYPGGENELFKYLGKNIKYPASSRKKGHEGIVFVRFVVGKSGELTDFQIKHSAITVTDTVSIKGKAEKKIIKLDDPNGDQDIENESLRVLKGMPNWKPGKQDGQPADVEYTLPIRFKLE